MLFWWLPAPLLALYYYIFYHHDLLRFLHPRSSPAGWNAVFGYLKLPYKVEKARNYTSLVAVGGVFVSAVADVSLLPIWTYLAVQFSASVMVMTAVIWYLGPPTLISKSMNLVYPRGGAMRFPKVKGAVVAGAKEADTGDLNLFYVSLRDGHFMSQPVYEPAGSFVNSLVLTLEAQAPRFAWVQFIFERFSNTQSLAAARYGLLHEPDNDSTWAKMAAERVKALNSMISQPLLAVAIRGVWAGGKDEPHELPFRRCADSLDQLAVFGVRDPRLLVLMAERRTEFNLPSYFSRYFGGRTEAPAFVLSADNLPFFVGFPSMGNIRWGAHADLPSVSAWNSSTAAVVSPVTATMEVSGVPRLNRALEKDELARLAGLASGTPRSLELMYYGGQTHVLLSGDIGRYEQALASVYGQLNLVPAPDIWPLIFGDGEKQI